MYNIPQEMIDEFNKEMYDISNNRDYQTESRHISMDVLMGDTLKKLGFGDGVSIFYQTSKWYC